jgi:hypothetical protein
MLSHGHAELWHVEHLPGHDPATGALEARAEAIRGSDIVSRFTRRAQADVPVPAVRDNDFAGGTTC